MKGSIEIDAFSIDGNWGYAYKKGLFRWTDSGTFHLAFTKLRVNITMSITIEGPDKQLKLVGGEGRPYFNGITVFSALHNHGRATVTKLYNLISKVHFATDFSFVPGTRMWKRRMLKSK